MIRRELAKDPNLATESWDRFLPQFRKRHLKTSEKTAKKNGILESKAEARKNAGLVDNGESSKSAKKVYTPFPPAQLPRKVCLSWSPIEPMAHCLSLGRPTTGVRRIFPQISRKRGQRDRKKETKGTPTRLFISITTVDKWLPPAIGNYRQTTR